METESIVLEKSGFSVNVGEQWASLAFHTSQNLYPVHPLFTAFKYAYSNQELLQ